MKRKAICTAAILMLGVMGVTASCIASRVLAKEGSSREKLVTSVEIQPGDTLWEIASRFITDDYESLSDYVEEIKHCNHLYENNIQVGQFLIIPYYE